MSSTMFILSIFIALICVNCQLSKPNHPNPQPIRIEHNQDILQCCALIYQDIERGELINCVNNTVVNNFDQVIDSIPYIHDREGPRMVVTLITRATPEIYHYAAYSYFLQAVYAVHNFYNLIPLYPDSKKPDYEQYRKITPIIEALEGVAVDSDYIVWLDAGNERDDIYIVIYYYVFIFLCYVLLRYGLS
jgi:hypothetical protein